MYPVRFAAGFTQEQVDLTFHDYFTTFNMIPWPRKLRTANLLAKDFHVR